MILTPDERDDVADVAQSVWGVVYTIIGIRSFPAWDATDAYQAAMERVCKARRRWNPARSSWKTFALANARGGILDFIRDERHGTRTNPVDTPLSLDAWPENPSGNGPLDTVDGYTDPEPPDPLLEAQLWEAVDHLPSRTAAVFRLYAEADLTMAEVGEITGVTESRVSQHVKAARECLAPIVEQITAAA